MISRASENDTNDALGVLDTRGNILRVVNGNVAFTVIHFKI